MQRIKKGLEEKLNIISKIQNNLKIKRYDIKKAEHKDQHREQRVLITRNPSPRLSSELPNIQRVKNIEHEENSSFLEYAPHSQHKNDKGLNSRLPLSPRIKNPQRDHSLWMSVKRISNSSSPKADLSPYFQASEKSKKPTKILFASSYTSRFTSKNSPIKFVEIKSSIDESREKSINFKSQIRKNCMDRTNAFLTPGKQHQQLNVSSIDSSFYGRINEKNHISGTKFKTLDPRFGGLSKDELKSKIKQMHRSPDLALLGVSSRQIHAQMPIEHTECTKSVQKDQSPNSSLYMRYSGIQEEGNYKFLGRSGKFKGRKGARPKEPLQIYTPWDEKEEDYWDDLPKIK